MLAVATDVPDLSAPGMARLYPIGKFPSNGRQTSNVYCKVERGEIPKMLACQYAWLRNVPNQGFTVPPSFKRISYAWFVGLGVPRHTGPPMTVNAPLRCLPPSAHPILDEPLDKVRTRHTVTYERILILINIENTRHARSLLKCPTLAILSLREDRGRAMLTTCSRLLKISIPHGTNTLTHPVLDLFCRPK
jgi:hypothetical protein